MSKRTCSQGSHPHSDRPNWEPAETIGDYLRNCEEGLEAFSQRRAAKLLGWSRVKLWRMMWIAELPNDLFDRLMSMEGRKPSERELAEVARGLFGRGGNVEIDRCPHCGEIVRVRPQWRMQTAEVVNDWLRENAEG